MHRRSRLSAPGLLVFLAVFSGCARNWIGEGFPRPGTENVTVKGLNAAVRLDYDEYYVPHIRALSVEDAMFGLGYATASARQFQMDILRRTARGELSLLTGPTVRIKQGERTVTVDMVEVDTFLRILDFADTGKRMLARTSPRTRAGLDAFAAGVNAFAYGRSKTSPPYSIPGWLGGKSFKPWSAEDTAAVTAMMTFTLSNNLADEEFAVAALRENVPLREILDWVSPEVAQPLEPYAYLEPFRGNLENLRFLRGVGDLGAVFTGTLHEVVPSPGSNVWAVGGSRSATGKPIFANDPHLSASAPPPWFIAHVQCPGFNAVGAFIPGVPAPMIGHNDAVAWGVTVTYADTVDLAIESIDGDAKTYTVGGRTLPLAHRTIHVGKDRYARDVTIYATGFGPLVTPVTPGATRGVSLNWTGWDGSALLETGSALFQVQSAKDMAKLAPGFGALPLNLVYADVDGHFGHSILGDIPIRQGYTGLLPKDGSNPAQSWTGLLPYDDRPNSFDPKEGFVASANNRPTGRNADAVGTSFAAPYRHRRIVERLKAKDKWTPEEIAALQLDRHSTQADAILPIVLAIPVRDQDAKEVQAQLEGWKRDVKEDSRGALYYEVFVDTFDTRALRKLPEPLRDAYRDHDPFRATPADAIPRAETGWWGGEMERSVLIEEALAETARRLRVYFGDNLRTATWGDLHRLYLEHALADAKVIGGHYRLPPMPEGGDAYTINATPFLHTTSFDVKAYASLRWVVDLSKPGRSWFTMPGGQSEIPTHPSYASLLKGWYEGGRYPLLFDEADIADKPLPSTLILNPVP